MRIELILAGLGLAAALWMNKKHRDQRERDKRGTYRPGSARGDGVRFSDPDAGADKTGAASRDAFTGEDLDPDRAIYQCQNCRAWYHGDTLRSLQHDNAGRCISCSDVNIVRDRVTEERIRKT